jgi:hypothetical protein
MGVDVENYWGKGVPLKGIRVLALSNNKTVDVRSREETARIGATMTPQSTASYVCATGNDKTPKFEEDIKPLFRERDVIVMQAVAGFNLHKYEDVKANADKILGRLRLNMPCDGLWPPEDIAKFEAWKNGGMPA